MQDVVELAMLWVAFSVPRAMGQSESRWTTHGEHHELSSGLLQHVLVPYLRSEEVSGLICTAGERLAWADRSTAHTHIS